MTPLQSLEELKNAETAEAWSSPLTATRFEEALERAFLAGLSHALTLGPEDKHGIWIKNGSNSVRHNKYNAGFNKAITDFKANISKAINEIEKK